MTVGFPTAAEESLPQFCLRSGYLRKGFLSYHAVPHTESWYLPLSRYFGNDRPRETP